MTKNDDEFVDTKTIPLFPDLEQDFIKEEIPKVSPNALTGEILPPAEILEQTIKDILDEYIVNEGYFTLPEVCRSKGVTYQELLSYIEYVNDKPFQEYLSKIAKHNIFLLHVEQRKDTGLNRKYNNALQTALKLAEKVLPGWSPTLKIKGEATIKHRDIEQLNKKFKLKDD